MVEFYYVLPNLFDSYGNASSFEPTDFETML